MIPIDTLRAVRRIFVHRQSADTACADGRAAAILLNAAIPAAEIVEVTYEQLPRLKPERGTLFCDLTPWAPKPKGATPTPDEKQARIDAMAPWIDAEVLRDEVDIVIGFAYVQSGDRVSLKWSLRSRGDVDVAAIAERHGGGGHTAAAGFHEVIIGDGHMAHMANPYARAEVLFA